MDTLTNYTILVILLIILTIIILKFIRQRLLKRNITFSVKIQALADRIKEEITQQQVVYNLSTSIYLLNKREEIINNVLSEITEMYKWPDVAFFSTDDQPPIVLGEAPDSSKEEVFEKLKQGIETFEINKAGRLKNVGLFPVGYKGKMLGALYMSSTNKEFTKDRLLFFETIAISFTIALENYQ